MVSNIPLEMPITDTDQTSDDSDEDFGQAQNNPKASKANNKKVVGASGAGDDDPSNYAKSKIQKKIEKRLQENSNVLSLSNQRLQDLGDLQKMTTVIFDLQMIDISRNYLDNIDILNSLKKLKHIIASENYIRAVNLQLPKLQELNLQNNQIEKVPILSQMPQLKVLILNANKISEMKLTYGEENKRNIMKMAFKNNRIKFTNERVIYFVKMLKEFKALRVLNFEGNPFELEPQINTKIIRGLPQNLEMYNNQKKVYIQSTIAKETPDTAATPDIPVLEENKNTAGGAGEEETKTPTLEHLLYNLEAANSHPNRALEFLKQLYVDAEKIKQVQKSQSQSDFQSFTRAKDTHTIQENIETFMQHAQLLVDNHFELRSIILSILSKLTIIRSHGFGVKCFYTLRDLMVAGKDLEQQVMEQLTKNVIDEMNELSPHQIEVSILQGLKDLVEKQQSHQTNLMFKLFDTFFPKWLNEIKLQFFQSKNKSRDDESVQTDAILALLTASLRGDRDNVAKMYDKRLHDVVAEIFLKTDPSKSRYIHLLECMNEIAKMHDRAASSYIDKWIHREIMQEIKLTFNMYKKSQDLAPADNKDNIAQTVKRYRVFSSQIELIASLLNAEVEHRERLLQEPLIRELLQVLTHNNTDPILLTSICYLAEKILNCESIKSDPDKLADKINRMQSCENLLPYLGMGKYRDLLQNTQKYNNQEDQVAQQDGNEAALEYLNDPIIHRLFIQIIRLIEFFCKQLAFLVRAEKETKIVDENRKKLKNLYEQVSDRLNDQHREEALFNCLKIPNDDVRLAVVDCLYYVPIEQIDAEEIDSLLKLMSPQNIGAGKTELVLSVIFNILSNLISDNSQKTSVTTTLFKTKFSYTAITLAINILTKNQERQVDDEEEEQEKYTLSLSVLNFLKHVSKEAKTRDQLKNKGDVLKTILFSEQQYTECFYYIETPVEVETTMLGMDFESLRNSITQGFESIEPYNYVSFRILHQMANLLQKPHAEVTYEPENLGDNQMNSIIMAYRRNLKIKTDYETKFWTESTMGGEGGLEYDNRDAFREMKKHHKVFTKKNGVKGILHFLFSQRNEVENWLRQNYDPAINHAGSKEKHAELGRGLKYKIMKQKKKEEEKKNPKNSNKKKKKLGVAQQKRGQVDQMIDPNKKVDSTQAMMQCFRDEELGSGYHINDTEVYLSLTKAKNAIMAKREFDKMTSLSIKNPEIRSLCVAAFLRCLYASIDNAPDKDYHEQAINNLKSDKTFTQITQLCASTNWQMCNIGSKYLQVMHYITRVHSSERLEAQDNLIKYEIISIVIKRILGLLREKIKNENNNMELTADDQNLLCHLAVICHQLVSQCVLFDWRKKNKPYKNIETDEEREVRYNLINFMMSKLFPLDQVQILIDVLFTEMLNANQRLHSSLRDEEQQRQANMGSATLEHTKRFLMNYLAYCHKNKFAVLQYLMHNMVFVGKNMREGFLEEILEGTNQIHCSNLHLEQMSRDDAQYAQSADNDSDEENDDGQGDLIEPMYCRTLAFQLKNELQIWRQKEALRVTPKEKEKKDAEFKENKKDCVLGERILFSQPMNVHVRYSMLPDSRQSQEYKVCTVILTNKGVYIIDDKDTSFKQDPLDREEAERERQHELNRAEQPRRQRERDREESKYRGPDKVERFSYIDIKRISRSYRVKQRLVIEAQKDYKNSKGNLYEAFEGHQARGNDRTAGGGNSRSEQRNRSQRVRGEQPQDHPDFQVKRTGKSAAKVVKKPFWVTLVLPNAFDMGKMTTIFNEVVNPSVQEGDEEELDDIADDKLLNVSIMRAINVRKSIKNRQNCPFCQKLLELLNNEEQGKNSCSCGENNLYHLVYSYWMRDENALEIPQNSKQRGGVARMLGTDLRKHNKNLRKGIHGVSKKEEAKMVEMQPVFGILVISTKEIFFLKEIPHNWRPMLNQNAKQIHDNLYTNIEAQAGGLEETKQAAAGLTSPGGRQEYAPAKELVHFNRFPPGLEQLITDPSSISLNDIQHLRVINQRIPTLEIELKRQGNKQGPKRKVWFSMMSDYNLQESLHQMKKLKKEGNRRGNVGDSD